MLEVARLRVAGRSWADIAEVLPRAATTMAHWPYRRAAGWSVALGQAIDEALRTYENEALLTTRNNLRKASPVPDPVTGAMVEPGPELCNLAQRAANDLLRHCRELRGTRMKLEHDWSGSDPIRLIMSMSDDELREAAGGSPDAD